MDSPLVKVMIKMEFAKCAPNLEHGWFGESVAKISPRWSHYIWDTSVARRQAWKSITLMHDDRRDEPPPSQNQFQCNNPIYACSTMTLKSLIEQLVDLFHCISTKHLSFLIDMMYLYDYWLGIACNYWKDDQRSPAKLSNILNFIAGVLFNCEILMGELAFAQSERLWTLWNFKLYYGPWTFTKTPHSPKKLHSNETKGLS